MSHHQVHIIGGGLAGSEAAWQLAQAGVRVRLSEMRGAGDMTPAHQTDGLAELVCSNSFRSDDADKNAVGLLHQEMRRLGSLIMASAEPAKVPAGSALAVDRHVFSQAVTRALAEHPNIEIVRERIDALPDEGMTIVATGPLTAPVLATSIGQAAGMEHLAFFDAIAPVIHRDSIDMEQCWMANRWDKIGPGGGEGKDYINCPMDKDQYHAFVQGLLDGEKTEFKEWEANTPYFEGCMPIEVMASRGPETLRHGPMKPMGLDNPNTFIQSPKLLDATLRLKSAPHIRFAGQMTGCEGYVESAAIGLIAGRFAAAELLSRAMTPPPADTALGALLGHVTGNVATADYQPMNVNFGLFPPLDDVKKKQRKEAYTARARSSLGAWMGELELA